jgi:hypothetical protein
VREREPRRNLLPTEESEVYIIDPSDPLDQPPPISFLTLVTLSTGGRAQSKFLPVRRCRTRQILFSQKYCACGRAGGMGSGGLGMGAR